MRGRAHAKVNLGLRVRPVRDDGYHPIVSLAQSVGWSDEMALEVAERDRCDVTGEDLGPPQHNLAWRAVAAVRGPAGPSLHLSLDKAIPVAAGLGGGSADAALGLALATGVLGRDTASAVAIAPGLGADVPFCLAGGTAWLEGLGERVTRIPTPADFWLGLVVPPFRLATPAVYRRWDELGGPEADGLDGRDLPVSLRDHGPLGNDLLGAALDLEPGLGDWITDLARSWGQPVLMSGSGPTLFGFFSTRSEAADAVTAVAGARAARACTPVPVGWKIEDAPPSFPPAPWG